MDPAWLRALCLLLCAVGMTTWLWLVWRTPELSANLTAHRRQLDAELRMLRQPALGRVALSVQLTLCTLLASLAMATRTWLPCCLATLVWCGPFPWLSRRRAARLTSLEAQLGSWLLALANALRATPSLGEALASTSSAIAPPLRDELEHVLKEWRLGIPLDQALQRTSARVGSRTLAAAFLTLRIARASGGGVSGCLESAAATLREMSRLDAVVRTKTAEGKGQALVISVLPFPFVGLLPWLDPGFLAPLFATSQGHALLALCAALWLAAVLLARRFVQLDL
jgi:tight adherence protein B